MHIGRQTKIRFKGKRRKYELTASPCPLLDSVTARYETHSRNVQTVPHEFTVGCELTSSGFAVWAEGLDKFILRTETGPLNNKKAVGG